MTKHEVEYEARGGDELSKAATKSDISHHLLRAPLLEGATLRGWDE